MSDARDFAIHKAATELVEELIAATANDGGAKWFDIIVRKMKRLPDRGTLKVKPRDPMLTLTECGLLLHRAPFGLSVNRYGREVAVIKEAEIAKLKLWLNGERP